MEVDANNDSEDRSCSAWQHTNCGRFLGDGLVWAPAISWYIRPNSSLIGSL